MAKIMLVEDDNNLREIYGARLLAEGHEIVTAKDGEEALATAVKEKPDLIISDVMMPRISGFDMLDILRNAPETKFTKVIMMTALSQAEDKARADNLGADRYLVKSQVTLEDVARVVRDVLEGKTEDTPMPPVAEAETSEAPATTETPGVSASTEAPTNDSSPDATDQDPGTNEVSPEQTSTPPVANPEVIPINEPVVPASTPSANPVAPPASDPVTIATPDPVAVTEPVTPAPAPDPLGTSDNTPTSDPVTQDLSQSTTNVPSDTPALPEDTMQAVEASTAAIVTEETAVLATSPAQVETADQTVMPDPLDVVSQPTVAKPAAQTPTPEIASPEATSAPAEQPTNEPAPAFTVQLPSQNQVVAVGAEPAVLATPVATPDPVTPVAEPVAVSTENTSTNAEPFVGPNLAEALQAEEAAAEQGSAPAVNPVIPAPDSTPLVGNITLPQTPEATPAPEPQSAPVLPTEQPSGATEAPQAEAIAPVETPAPTSQEPVAQEVPAPAPEAAVEQPAPAEESAPNPLNDETKKKLVIQPLHDLNTGPDLNALLEKEKALEAVLPPSANSVVAPQLVGNEIMPATPAQPSATAPQTPISQPNEHDSIAL